MALDSKTSKPEFVPFLITGDQETVAQMFEGPEPAAGDALELYCYESGVSPAGLKFYKCRWRVVSAK